MKKIGQKEILEAILMEALVIKRKKELFEEAKKINQELKMLNEEIGARTGGFGPGFANYKGASPVMGISTQSQYEPEEDKNSDCGCKLDQFSQLEKDVEGFGSEEQETNGSTSGNELETLAHENAELKEKLSKIENALASINEGLAQTTTPAAKSAPQTGKTLAPAAPTVAKTTAPVPQTVAQPVTEAVEEEEKEEVESVEENKK